MPARDIPDLSGVSLQCSYVESRRPDKPSASSTLRIRRFSMQHNDGSTTHTVIGVHVLLKKGDPNGLWDSLNVDRASQKIDGNNPQVAVRALTICCDTLEISGEFSLPEAEVAVFARCLRWADDAAAINTSPLAWTVEKARNAAGSTRGEDGANGRKAGSLRIFLKQAPDTGPARPRLIAAGGRGQDPGAGQDGTDGDWMNAYARYPFSIRDSGMSTSKRTVEFSPTAVFVEYEWRWAASRVWGPGTLGEKRFPTNGTSALAPGKPGSGGDGGGLTCNQSALQAQFYNPGGAAGKQERNYRGGAAGRPLECAHYHVKLWENLFGTDSASFELSQTEKRTSKAGSDALSQGAERPLGAAPTPTVLVLPNGWLHPLGLQATLEFARDLFLAGARDEVAALLADYAEGLAGEPPANGAWNTVPASQWSAAQSEVAAMLQRLHGQLDYFGHPAGYTPLLSLPGAIKLYADETRRALRMMLVTRWVSDTARDAKESADSLTEALDAMIADSKAASEQVAAGEARIDQVRSLINSLEKDLTDLSNRLVVLRNDLLVKVINDKERQKAIKFSIKMAGALCQVIPVGQPALGTVGSLASVAADFVGGDPDEVPDTVSKMGGVLKKASEAAEKAKEASKKAAEKKDAPAAKNAAGAKEQSSAWATVGKGLGPALEITAGAIKALQVPKAEIDAELARLESEDPAWNRMTREIRELNEKKATLFGNLIDAIQMVGEGFARLAGNAGMIVSLWQQREKSLGRIDPEAVMAVQQLGQRSRLTLQKYLYLMVKAYESTLLKPLEVDWNLTAVTDKINALLQPGTPCDAAFIKAQGDVLDTLFQQNLSAVRSQLLDNFDMRERTQVLRLGLSTVQTPEEVAALCRLGQVVVDPQRHGLVLPNQQLARLSAVTLARLVFDPAGPPLRDDVNVLIGLVPAPFGTMRRGEGIYRVTSDAPVRWSWTCFGGSDIRPAQPSATASDVLDFVLGDGSERIRQRVALPPVWSDFTINLQFSPPLRPEERPRITQLLFELSIDSSPAPDFQRVLAIRESGETGGAVTTCSADLGGRSSGFGSLIRIYNKGDTVKVSVPQYAGGAAFERWDVIGASAGGGAELNVPLDDNVLAVACWTRAGEREAEPVILSRVIDSAALATIAEEHGDEGTRHELHAARMLQAAPPPPAARAIRAEPAAEASVIGIIPPDGEPELVEQSATGWLLMNYRGVVGWVVGEPS